MSQELPAAAEAHAVCFVLVTDRACADIDGTYEMRGQVNNYAIIGADGAMFT
jgi:hypothetical protein